MICKETNESQNLQPTTDAWISVGPPSSEKDGCDVEASTAGRRGRKPSELSQEIVDEIARLSEFYGSREIAKRLGLSRKRVRRQLQMLGLSTPAAASDAPSKLEPYYDAIESRVRKDLTTKRILREIRQLGYQGGRTILGQHVRKLKTQLALSPHTRVKRRFETTAGEEMQIDWSPYHLEIDGRVVRVHALGCLLAFSRKLHVRVYRDESQSTLLEGLAVAFEYFDGVTARLVVDNMATAVLGRIGPHRNPLWNDRFERFVAHYGTEPFACKVKDPDRKGKKEKSFRLLYDDFLKGSEFASWDDLHERLRIWLDETPEVANLRNHGTTKRVPNEAFEAEHPLLIRLPEHRFAVYNQAVRVVDHASTLSIRGTPYTIPAHLADRSVAVRLYAEHFEVLDPQGRVALSRRYVPDSQKGRLVIDPSHYANLPSRRHTVNADRIDEAFIKRFPELQPLVDGLKLRMKTFAPMHIRALFRLCGDYGQEPFVQAAMHAQQFRRFNAHAVKRILEQRLPDAPLEPVAPLTGDGASVLGNVDPGSIDDFAALDSAPMTSPNLKADQHHGA